MMDHEKLDVYKVAIDFLAISIKIIKDMPKGYAYLSDQFKRASLSIPLNIAEGCGKFTKNDKKRFYAIARGSAMECAAILDACHVLEIITERKLKDGKNRLRGIVSMLTKLSQHR